MAKPEAIADTAMKQEIEPGKIALVMLIIMGRLLEYLGWLNTACKTNVLLKTRILPLASCSPAIARTKLFFDLINILPISQILPFVSYAL